MGELLELGKELDNFAYRLAVEGVDYSLLHYSNWDEFEESAPDLYAAIRKATDGLEEMINILEVKYGRKLEDYE